MDKAQYRKKFIKAIRFAPKTLREEILADLDAILADPTTELGRLGTPEYLAKQYLQDAEISVSIWRRVLLFSRNILAILGMIVVALIAIAYGLYSYYTDYRPFDYANVGLARSHEKFNHEYSVQVSEKRHFIIEQANVALYSHDDSTILLRCAGSLGNPKSLIIRQNACAIFVPKQAFSLAAEQTSVTLVTPENDWDIRIKHGTLFLHQGTNSYRIIQEFEEAGGVRYPSDKNAKITLKIKTFQAATEVYQPD